MSFRELVEQVRSGQATLADCCTVTYSHPVARLVLGESLHPGGLSTTARLADAAGIDAGCRVLDAGCGRGASAIHLAKTRRCHVTGVTLEEEGVAAAANKARSEGLGDLTDFRGGDLLQADLEPEGYDVVLLECVLSILPDKALALQRLRGALKKGGRLAFTDVTVVGPLPAKLQGILAVAGCVGDARSAASYRDLVESQGFAVTHAENLPDAIPGLLESLKGKMMMAEIAVKLGKLPIDPETFSRAKEVFVEVQRLAEQGTLGYGLIVATRAD